MQAIFLGAGASYDCGMPLVCELTAELRRWLSPEKLISLNQGWQNQGGGWSDNVINKLIKLLKNKDLHYENIVGALEVELQREKYERTSNHFSKAHGFILQAIHGLLLERQHKNNVYATNVLNDFKNIKQLVATNRPLWVFSLNHDVLVEMLAAKFSIPIKSGFKEKISVSMSSDGIKLNNVDFEYLSRSDMKSKNYSFFKPGEEGINLVKLHGSLDIFAHGDDVNYLKALPKKSAPEEFPELISQINTTNIKLAINSKVPCTNECIYLDEHNEVQFLRNTLLAGAHKFSKKVPQLAPPEFLQIFRSQINLVSELICIGYSFGDQHIDDTISEWLTFVESRSLSIINPGVEICPPKFIHLFDQITCHRVGAAEFMVSLNTQEDSMLDKSSREIRKLRRDQLKTVLTSEQA